MRLHFFSKNVCLSKNLIWIDPAAQAQDFAGIFVLLLTKVNFARLAG
jgi:hypothetical protein